jgi:hypothetical protein
MDRQYVGIDFHRRRSVIVRVSAAGEKLSSVGWRMIRWRSRGRWRRRARIPRWSSRPPTGGTGWSICIRDASHSKAGRIGTPDKQAQRYHANELALGLAYPVRASPPSEREAARSSRAGSAVEVSASPRIWAPKVPERRQAPRSRRSGAPPAARSGRLATTLAAAQLLQSKSAGSRASDPPTSEPDGLGVEVDASFIDVPTRGPPRPGFHLGIVRPPLA